MSDSNRAQLSYVKETTWGTTPASALTNLRFTSESLAFNVANITSEEIRDDRQITDLIQTGADTGGGYEWELSFESPPDELLEGALFSDFTTAVAVNVTGDISAANADNSYNSTTTDFTAQNMNVGQFIFVGGFATSGNNGWKRITSIATNKIIVQSATALTDEAAGSLTITMDGEMLRNGTTEYSFSIQRALLDVVEYFIYRGMMINTFNVTAATNSILTGGFEFIGKDSALQQTSWGTGSNVDAPTGDVMNAVSNVGYIWENNAPIAADLYLSEVSFSLSNNLRGISAIGNLGFVDIGTGTCEVTGSMNAYFIDDTLYDKYLAGTETALGFAVTDADGNSYMFSFPRIKFITDSGPQAGGMNQDLMENITWQAIRHATYDCTIQIDKYDAP